jgi:hypothetical protein
VITPGCGGRAEESINILIIHQELIKKSDDYLNYILTCGIGIIIHQIIEC